ncbi:DUF998 domain-containing protein [Planomonospora algeriensis]
MSSTTRLQACGVAIGPVFLGVWLVQALTREGFDPARHPLSLLSLGDPGWIQVANFIVAGLLYLGFAAGVRRALRPMPGATWAPVLLGLSGAGMIMAGVFPTDPGAGFPPGAPAGMPEYTVSGVLHEAGFLLASLSWSAACLVLARSFAAVGRRGWIAACLAVPAGVFALVGWPDPSGLTVRLLIASAVQFAFVAALAVRIMRGLPRDLGAPHRPLSPVRRGRPGRSAPRR